MSGRDQDRDFWLLVPDYLTAAEAEMFAKYLGPSVEDALGQEVVIALLERIKASSEFRADLFAQLRNQAWRIRAGRGYCASTRASAAFFWEGVHVLHRAGAKRDDLLAFIHCALSGCVCAKCDLRTGARFDYLGR